MKKFVILLLLNFIVVSTLFSICPYNGCFSSEYNCPWQRSSKKCNSDSECCPGMRCSSFGYCEIDC